ncbi:MAG: hypothetical protein NTU79_07405 [Planctomycetota bacterium]|nr:hypothetical protein [Planctomycetota bacterium]
MGGTNGNTAAAVLAYKTKRKIINRDYQMTADNIVGKMTMASLDREMLGRKPLRKCCGCDYRPAGAPSRKPFFVSFALSGSQLNVGAPSATSTLAIALATVPDAMKMRNKAKLALDDLVSGSNTTMSALCLVALKRHYKVSAVPDIDQVAREVRNSLAAITGRLLSARAWLQQGSGPGFAETPQPRDGHTYIMLDYPRTQGLLPPTILVHEAFHDLDQFNEDFGGNPVNDGAAKYHQNDTRTQLNNAFAMSQFVLHISEGQEKLLRDTD